MKKFNTFKNENTETKYEHQKENIDGDEEFVDDKVLIVVD